MTAHSRSRRTSQPAAAALLAALAACAQPPDGLDIEPLSFSATSGDLPPLSGLCGSRGRLFASGRSGAAGLILEEGAVGLSQVVLEDALPPMSSCWQADSAEVFFVGGATSVVRTPEGEWLVEDIAAELGASDVAVNAVAGLDASHVFAVGRVDGRGALITRQLGGWSRIDANELELSELRSISVHDGIAFAAGGNSALRWDGISATRLGTPTARLSAIAASGSGVWAVSEDGLVLELRRNHFVSIDSAPVPLTSIALSNGIDLWIGGDGGFIGRYLRLESGSLATLPRTAQTPSDSDVVALQAVRDGLAGVASVEAGSQLWTLD